MPVSDQFKLLEAMIGGAGYRVRVGYWLQWGGLQKSLDTLRTWSDTMGVVFGIRSSGKPRVSLPTEKTWGSILVHELVTAAAEPPSPPGLTTENALQEICQTPTGANCSRLHIIDVFTQTTLDLRNLLVLVDGFFLGQTF